ncbi:MAG: asparagine synthetase B [Pseudomonadota bacterium]
MSGVLGATFWQETTEQHTEPQALAAARARSVARARSARALLDRRGDLPLDWYDERLYMGVVDRSGVDSDLRGQQPYAARDGGAVVAVDGSLIGARSLRRELGSQAFRGNGAAEIILRGYRRWGTQELLRRLRGQFAFALYDRRDGRLVLARDALGSRPLYYRMGRDGVQFASELRVLRQLLDEAPPIDNTAAFDFLTYGYVPAPKTLYRDVQKLRAGHWLDMDLNRGAASLHCHWAPQRTAASGQTESDFVSRGSELLGRAFDDRRAPGRDALFSDFGSALGDLCATRAGANNAPAARSGSDAAPSFESDCRDWFDEPALTVDLAARADALAALGVSASVVLCDVGLPILCGAAPRYGVTRAGRWRQRLRSTLRREDGATGVDRADLFERYGVALGGLPRPARDAQREVWQLPDDYDDHWLFAAHFFPEFSESADAVGAGGAETPDAIVGALQRLDLATLVPDRLLTELDRVGTRAGVEIRAPFLDQDLLDWILAAPPALAPPAFDLAVALLPGAAGGSMLQRMSGRLQRTGRRLRDRVGAARTTAASAERLVRLGAQYPEFDSA